MSKDKRSPIDQRPTTKEAEVDDSELQQRGKDRGSLSTDPEFRRNEHDSDKPVGGAG